MNIRHRTEKTGKEENPGSAEITGRKKKHLLLAIILAAVAAAIVTAIILTHFWVSSHYLPGTTVNGIDISGMTEEEARDAADTALAEYTLTVTGRDTEDVLTAEDIGLACDYSADGADILQDLLRSQNLLSWLFSGGERERSAETGHTYDTTKTEEAVDGFSCLDPDLVTEPEDAYLEYRDGEYMIIPETEGTVVSRDTLLEAVYGAIDELGSEILLEGMYTEAEITSDDETLVAEAETANRILSSEVTVSSRLSSASPDRDTINSFLVFGEDGEVSLDRDLVYDWVTENISTPNLTVGNSRTISTPSSGTITVSGGTYGYRVSAAEETTQLMEDLLAGETVEREPVWSVEECGSSSNDGVGDTYIDINIASQMVYVVKDGSIDFSTECVTGDVATGYSTPTGIYYVSWKTTDYTMKTYDAFVNYWMPIDDSTGVGLHDATWRSSFGGEIYKTNGSHGCINLPYSAAEYIYKNTSTGIPVIVH